MCFSKKELALLCKRNLLILFFISQMALLFTQSLGPKLCCLFGFFTFFFLNSASNPSANPISLHKIPLIQHPHFPYCYLLSPSHHSLSQMNCWNSHQACLFACPLAPHPHPLFSTYSPGDILQRIKHFTLLSLGLQWLLTCTIWKVQNIFHGFKVLYFSSWLLLHLFYDFNSLFIILPRTCHSGFISGILLFHLPEMFLHQKFTWPFPSLYSAFCSNVPFSKKPFWSILAISLTVIFLPCPISFLSDVNVRIILI